MMERTRQEHIDWCKQRAHEAMNYRGDYSQGVASMISDLGKHPKTEGLRETASFIMLTVKDKPSAVRFIDGF